MNAVANQGIKENSAKKKSVSTTVQATVYVKITNAFVQMATSERIAHYTNARITALNKAPVIVKPVNAVATQDFLATTAQRKIVPITVQAKALAAI